MGPGGSKGGPKGPIICFKCGKPGHKQADCRVGINETSEQPVSAVGGIWMIANVTEDLTADKGSTSAQRDGSFFSRDPFDHFHCSGWMDWMGGPECLVSGCMKPVLTGILN